jgi:hypothetical protein
LTSSAKAIAETETTSARHISSATTILVITRSFQLGKRTAFDSMVKTHSDDVTARATNWPGVGAAL